LGREDRLSFHEEIMPPDQRRALGTLGRHATEAGFYLAGGTAVAIQIGHRQSIDFDWFTPAGLDDPMAFAGLLRSRGIPLETRSVAPGTLHATVGGVRCSFLSYRYPLLEATVPWPEYSCDLASLADLACMKLAAIAQRGARKDFLDIVAIAERGFTLPQMLDLYRRKYDTADVAHVLASLCYFDDAEREPMPTMLVPSVWGSVRTTVRSWVKAYGSERRDD
jgi:hypothetical protein